MADFSRCLQDEKGISLFRYEEDIVTENQREWIRARAYLNYVKPKTAELIVDEMLAICQEISDRRAKKESEEANARYNEKLYYGIGNEED